MRSTWTDSRLDDLKRDVDARFDDLSQRMDAGFARVDADIRGLRGEIGALNRTILQVGGGLMGIVLIGFVGLIAS